MIMLCLNISNDFSLTQDKMPVDYASYLLAASPPGFDMAYALRDQFGLEDTRKKRNPFTPIKSTRIGEKPSEENDATSEVHFTCPSSEYDEMEDEIATLFSMDFQSSQSNSLPVRNSYSLQDISSTNNNNSSNGQPGSKKGMKKSVSFADDIGKSLVQVRILHERTESPPTLCPQFLSSLAEGAQAAITDTPPLSLNFAQPAANYKAFREKIENECVALENVIVREYRLVGTIKVKNISFEKKVVVRFTYDSWNTVTDVNATYVPNYSMPSSSCSQFDTFSFEMDIPPTFDPTKKIQFAILYETGEQQFWDNNNGKNYEVTSPSHKKTPESKTTDNGVYDLNHEDRWTEFSNWSSVDNSVPYW